jgi:hypothetical protein
MDPAMPTTALSTVGQDWDCSLHQLSRAVVTLYQVGYSFPVGDQTTILDRLELWSGQACHTSPTVLGTAGGGGSLCPPIAAGATVSLVQLVSALGGYTAPTETYVQPGGAAPDCGGGGSWVLGGWPSVPRAPTVDNMAAAAVAVVRCGALSAPSGTVVFQRADDLARGILTTISSLYRDAGALAGWANVDTNSRSQTPEAAASLQGTYYAVFTVMLLSSLGPVTTAPTSTGIPALPGLTGFLHMLGGPLAALAPQVPWGGSYVPG